MGACLGHIISKILDPISKRFYRSHTMSFKEDEQVEFDPDFELNPRKQLHSKRLLSFLIMKRLKKRNKGSTLQLIEDDVDNDDDDDDWPRKYTASTSYDSDAMSLQSINFQKIIRDQGGISSPRACSSLDLEWEHEGIPLCNLELNQKEKSCNSSIRTADNSHQSCSLTASPWSRVSSPDSLEWDPVEADVMCLDIETERLIIEIERLTDKTLRETGDYAVTS